jgi:hypothetical protein
MVLASSFMVSPVAMRFGALSGAMIPDPEFIYFDAA